MRRLPIILASLVLPALALAAPAFERAIALPSITKPSAVFLAVPDAVLKQFPLSDLRVMKNNAVVPQKSAESGAGELSGVITEAILCSNDVGSFPSALHDGNTGTAATPNALKNPTTCTMTLKFRMQVPVFKVSLTVDKPLKKLSVSAKNGAEYVKLREVENANTIEFSAVNTDGLKIAMTYDIAPAIGEVSLQGRVPGRILFMAEPGQQYVLAYGDTAPGAIPASGDVAATSATPYATVGAEVMTTTDSDGDGLINAKDNCPATKNTNQADQDHDGLGDACDNAPTISNALQNDSDNDGVGNGMDNCPQHFNPDQKDSDLNDVGDVCDDQDHDGVLNGKDNCAAVANPDQKDSDGNGAGDSCQLDRDSDGKPDAVDNCRSLPNPGQEDGDKDGIGDRCDSCPAVKNAGQEDTNSNGLGDACEGAVLDPDTDGVPNNADNCAAQPNADQLDRDNDGLGNVCDNCPTIQNRDQTDKDKDGKGDACTDTDGDALLPPLDNCPALSNPDQEDKNNNGIGDACEDDDGDQIINATDNCRYKSNIDQLNKDADAMGDACDEADDRLSEQYPWAVWIGLSVLVLVLITFAVRMVVRISRESGK